MKKTINHTITRDILLAAKIASKDQQKPVLNSVFITDEKIVATDSYKLIEITRKKENDIDEFPVIEGLDPTKSLGNGILINAKDLINNQKFFKSKNLEILNHGIFCNLKKNKVSIATTSLDMNSVSDYRLVDGVFPKYESILPKKINSSLKVSRKFLMDILSAFDEQEIKICFANNSEKSDEILYLETDNKKAMLMPLKEITT